MNIEKTSLGVCAVQYIGDGVYALFDGYQIWLRTNSHRDDDFDCQIALESNTMKSLVEFGKQAKTEETIQKISAHE